MVREMATKIRVGESQALPPGHYEGTIDALETYDIEVQDKHTGKQKLVPYLRISVRPNDGDIVMHPSFPLDTTPDGMTYNLLLRFGAKPKDIRPGSELDLSDYLEEGDKVQWTAVRKPNKNDPERIFTEVVRDTLSPA